MVQCDESIRRALRSERIMTVYVMIGAPASGKSTAAKELYGHIISSDAIREELYGDEAIQGNSKEVFAVFYNRVREQLSRGNNVVLDATNLTANNRKNIFENLKDYNCRYIAVRCIQPLGVLLERNSNRERVVPENVLIRMYHQYEEPTYEEGFEEIWRM